jgi:lysophospholipase L1-like esterase
MKPLLHVCALLLVCSLNAATPDRFNPERWEKAIVAIEARDRANPPPRAAVLFIGSSSFVRWTTLAADFPRVSVVNYGFGGSMMVDSVYHFDRLVTPVQPRVGVVYAGGNDLGAGKSPEEVAADARAFAAKWHAALPAQRLIFTSIQYTPARWDIREKIALTNAYLAAFCAADPRRVYLDLSSVLLSPTGEPRPELYASDRLHINPQGYKIWAKLLAPLLD